MNPVRKHWIEYLMVSALGWAVYALLLYAAGWGVRLLLQALQSVFGPLPIDRILDAVIGFVAALQFATAAALVLVFSYPRWPMYNPYLRVRLDAEANEQPL